MSRQARLSGFPEFEEAPPASCHPACMGLSLSRVSRHFLLPLSFHSFVRPAPPSILPPRPHISIAVARSGGQGRRFFSAAEGSSLTDASTAAGCGDRVVGRARIRGEPAIGPRIKREPRLYSVEPWVLTMKQ